MSRPSCLLGVDIGGTKIKLGAVSETASQRRRLRDDVSEMELLATAQAPTPRASPPQFYDALAALINGVREELRARHAGEVSIVCVAHPGRFLPDGRLARGTTPNLGARPHEFDGIHVVEELKRRLHVRVVAENDAISQMRFGLDALLRDPRARPHVVDETVVYLGPGTGMGGGVARVSRDGTVVPVTDGHFFDLQLPGIGDGTLTAEEAFTGPAIAQRIAEANTQLSVPIEPARSGRLDEILLGAACPPEHHAVAQRIPDQAGEVLATIIETIHAGRITKVRLEPRPDGTIARFVDEPDRAWPESDRALVRGARRFILGGFVGCSQGFGARMRERALAILRQRGLGEVSLFPIPVESADAGVLGAILAAKKVSGTFKAKSV